MQYIDILRGHQGVIMTQTAKKQLLGQRAKPQKIRTWSLCKSLESQIMIFIGTIGQHLKGSRKIFEEIHIGCQLCQA